MIRRWFFAGLLVWIPLGATLLVLHFVFGLLDSFLLLLPPPLRPQALLGYEIPGLGVALFLLLVLGTGVFAANFVGRRLVRSVDLLFAHIPLVRSIYGGVKQLAETLFSEQSSAFKKVVLVEYPRKGLWSIGFQAGEALASAAGGTGPVPDATDLVAVFIPTTPNPTSGFIMLAPREELQFLDLTVEEGMRLIISLGVVAPEVRVAQPGDLARRVA